MNYEKGSFLSPAQALLTFKTWPLFKAELYFKLIKDILCQGTSSRFLNVCLERNFPTDDAAREKMPEVIQFFGSLIRLLGVIWSSWKHSANTNSIVFQCLNVKIRWKQYCAKALTTVILESALSGITKAVLLNKAVFLFYFHALMLARQNFY